jgi:hypothetical protein
VPGRPPISVATHGSIGHQRDDQQNDHRHHIDGALAYAMSDDLQLDIGGNLGLTRDTPDLELYVGGSIRF